MELKKGFLWFVLTTHLLVTWYSGSYSVGIVFDILKRLWW